MGTFRKRSVPNDVWNSSSDDEESLSDSSSEDSDSDYCNSDSDQGDKTSALRTLENRGRTRKREHDLWRKNIINYCNKIRSRSRSFSPHRSRSRSSDLSAAESDDSDIQIIEGPIRDTGRGPEINREILATFPHQGEDDRHENERDHINGVRREYQGSSNRREEVYSSDDAQVTREWLPGRQNAQSLAEENRSPYRQAQSKQTSNSRQANHTGMVTIDVENSTRSALNEIGNGKGSSNDTDNCQSRSPLKRKGTESAGNTCDNDYSDNKQIKREPAESPLNATSSASPTYYSHQNRREPCTTEHQPRNQRSNFTLSSVNSQWTFHPVALPEHSAMDTSIENYHVDSDHFVNTPPRSPSSSLPNPSGSDANVVNGSDADIDSTDWIYERYYRRLYQSRRSFSRDHSRSFSRESNFRSPSRESNFRNPSNESIFSSSSRSRSRSQSRSFSPHRLRSRSSDLSAAESDDSDIQVIEGPIRDTGQGSEIDRVISATFPHQGEDDRHENERDHINGVRREYQGSSNRREEVYSSDDAQVTREWLPGRQNAQSLAEENRSPYRQAQSKQTSNSRQANHTGMVTIDVENSTRSALNEIGNGEGSSSNTENCQSRSPLKRKRTESAGDTCDNDYSDNKRRMREPAESPLNATSSASPTNSSHQNRREPCTTEHQPSHSTLSSVNSQWTFHPVALPELSAMDVENYLNHLDSDHSIELGWSPEGSGMTSSSVYDSILLYLPDESWYQFD